LAEAPSLLVVAGEASGDLHAAALLRELKARAPGLRAFGMGGAHCRAEGLEALVDARAVSVMGLVEVLPALPRILRAMRTLEQAARERRPAAALLVDLPDFNLRLAKKLHALRIPVAYYVSPTIWAWRPGRLRTIKKYVAKMLCILPFEERLYLDAGVPAMYVGHPSLDELGAPMQVGPARDGLGISREGQVLALLPGSRQSEVRRIFPAMLASARGLLATRPGLQLVVAVAPTIAIELLRREADRQRIAVRFVEGRGPEVVAASDAAIVASGTAVLEAALMQRPMVVVYRVSRITYFIAKRLVRVAHVALVNLLAGRRIVPELIQGAMRPARIAEEVQRLLDDPAARGLQLAELAQVRAGLGDPGASGRAADQVLALLGATGTRAELAAE